MSSLPAIFERAGMPAAAAAAAAGQEVLDSVCDINARLKAGNGAPLTASTSEPGGPTRNPKWPPGWCPPPYYEKIVAAYNEACGQIPDCGYVDAINQVIQETSFAQVEDQLGTISLLFYPTGMVGTGLTSDGKNPTTFVADFPVGSGESILLQQDDFDLPYRPNCMDLDLSFDGGGQAENYAKIRVKVWVNAKEFVYNTTGGQPVGNFGVPWNKRKVYRGKEFFCGDNCTNVAIQGRSGCAGIDQVGRESRLLIQIDNVGSANDIEAGTVEVDFAGFEKPCCNSCAIGGGCNCH